MVLDFHEYRAAKPHHAAFWLEAATRYKDHPGVIFGLLNEPHDISWKRHWKKAFLDAAGKFPVLMGEVGAQDTPMPFEKPGDFVPPEEWVPDMLATIQEHRLNWTAWCFHPKASPCLITGWDYAPTPYWGVFARRALAGEHFAAPARLR